MSGSPALNASMLHRFPQGGVDLREVNKTKPAPCHFHLTNRGGSRATGYDKGSSDYRARPWFQFRQGEMRTKGPRLAA
jgi:hypothetical protein